MASNSPREALSRDRQAMMQVSRKVRALEFLTLAQLKKKHLELFGEASLTKNKTYLRRKLAFRLQEQVEGGLSPEDQTRLEKLAPALLPTRDAPKSRPQKAKPTPANQVTRDARLPEVGSILHREFQGVSHEVEVLEKGFKYHGHLCRSLSAIAKAITGTNWNGFLFFGLGQRSDRA